MNRNYSLFVQDIFDCQAAQQFRDLFEFLLTYRCRPGALMLRVIILVGIGLSLLVHMRIVHPEVRVTVQTHHLCPTVDEGAFFAARMGV